MSIKNVLAAIPVRDLNLSGPWYERLFERDPDRRPMSDLIEFDFTGGSTLQIFVDLQRAGNGSATLAVSDLDAEITALARRNIEATDRSAGEYADTAMLYDPDDNRIILAEVKAGSGGPVELLNKLVRQG